jgi:hypothetical protein
MQYVYNKAISPDNPLREVPSHVKAFVEEDLMPHLKGMKTWQHTQRSATLHRHKQQLHDCFSNHLVAKKVIPPDSAAGKWLLGGLADAPGGLTAEGLEAGISSFAYVSALGGNLSPVSKNSLQSFVTVMNMKGMGPSSLARGWKELTPRLFGGTVDLWDEAANAGKGAFRKIEMDGLLTNWRKGVRKVQHPLVPEIVDTATGKKMKNMVSNFEAHLPEYVAHVGEADDMVKAVMAGDLATEGQGVPKVMKNWWDKTKDALLWGFGKSETGNRILGFYAGQRQHLYHFADTADDITNAVMRDANTVGRNVVSAAHFVGGPLGLPKGTMNMASQWRQFTHFPLRMVDFLAGSLRHGVDPSKLDFGTIARVGATGAIGYEVGKGLLGVDLSGGLGTGTLPMPSYEGAPFYPFPLVSPMVGVAGSLAQAALEGDPSKLGSAASLLVPGGIAARRAYRTLAPKFADYKNRTPEGRIPVYNDSRGLIGTFTPFQLALRTMGIKPINMSQEQGAAKWILKQRDKIRKYRREYLHALTINDIKKASRINQDFQKEYPNLGPLSVKKSDITAVRNRKEISRLNRILKGLPKDYQPIFRQAVGEVSLRKVTEDITANPDNLSLYLPMN